MELLKNKFLKHFGGFGIFVLKKARNNMTESEAIKEFQQNIDMPFGSNISREASKLAIQALEKQIPKKPDIEGDGYDPDGNLVYDTWICPACGVSYEIDYDKYDYCPACGQAIDQSEGE